MADQLLHRSVTKPTLHVVDETTGELRLPGCPACQDKDAKLTGLEHDYQALTKELATVIRQRDALKRDREEKLLADRSYPDALELIREWKRECGHPQSSETDPKRVALALAVVKRYRGQREKLSLVVQHGKHLAYRDPDSGFVYDEFGRLFGSSDEIEKRATQYWLWAKRQQQARPSPDESGGTR